MTEISFTKQDGAYISEAFPGNVNVQCVFADAGRYPLVIETRLDASLPWAKHSSVIADTTASVSLPDAAATQQFRILSHTKLPTASYEAIAAPANPEATAALADINERLADLEEGNEPLVLSTNFDTGNLEQEGVSSCNFGIDYENGYLTFETND